MAQTNWQLYGTCPTCSAVQGQACRDKRRGYVSMVEKVIPHKTRKKLVRVSETSVTPR